MRLYITTLSANSVEVEIEPEETVLALKTKLQTLLGKDASHQKLLRLGKILNNQETISELHLQEGDKLVLMFEQAKPAVTVKAPSQVPVPETQAPLPTQEIIPESQLVFTRPNSQAPVSVDAILQLVDLGFAYDQSERALRVAQGDVSGAVELLMTRENFTSEDLEFDSTSKDIQDLIQNPAFLELRSVLVAKPYLLGQILEQIEMSNPRLAMQMAKYPEQFKKLLTEPLPEVQVSPVQPSIEPLAPQEQLTPEQEADVRSLTEFGFRYEVALEVYISCGKNVEVAATYLFENYKQG